MTAPESLPSGTVTFLFTDIEGSTRLVQQFGERYPELLELTGPVFRDLDDRFMTGWALFELGALALKKMELASAHSLTTEALTIFDAVHDVTGIVLCLDGLAAIAEAERNVERGMRLAGAATALQASGGVDLVRLGRKMAGREDLAARAQSDSQLAAAWAEGQTMTTERAVAYALEDSGRGARTGHLPCSDGRRGAGTNREAG